MIPPLPLPSDDQLPADVVERLHKLPAIDLFRLIANIPGLLIPWTDLIAAVYQTSLSPRLREIIILRQATMARAPYELHQHVLIAQSIGITDEEIGIITAPEPVAALTAEENLICAMCDELEVAVALGNDLYVDARATFGDRQFIEIVATISTYCAVARFLNATRLKIESTNPMAGRTSPN